MISQKEAVFQAVTKFYGSKFENGMSYSKDDKAKIVAALVEGHSQGTFEIKNQQEDVKSYCVGLLNNHLRKDTRLNGGDKYIPENPGSRAGQGDEGVKAMRALLKTFPEGTANHAKVAAALSARVAEIKASKAKTVSIDINALPAELRDLLG